MSNQVEQKTVTPDEADTRLDRWFARHYPNLGFGALSKLLRTGQVRVDGKRCEGKTRLCAGQTVRIPPLGEMKERAKKESAPVDKQTQAARLKALKAAILYDDDDVVILNKPAGLAVQGGTGQKESLDDWLPLLAHGKDRPKLVHRLDKETSGVLVVARNAYAAKHLAEAFRERTTQKYYLAVLQSCPRPRKGSVDAPLLKTPTGKVIISTEGEDAFTEYRTLVKAKNGATLTLFIPHTGRTHQLRVHALHLGCPVVGDALYNDDAESNKHYGGLHLHAARLVIPHPREGLGFLDVAAPLPDLQAKTWQELGFDTARDWTEDND